jgi:hypothetical protein
VIESEAVVESTTQRQDQEIEQRRSQEQTAAEPEGEAATEPRISDDFSIHYIMDNILESLGLLR